MHPITDEILALLDDDKRLLVLEDSDKQQLISMIEKKIAEWLDNNPTALFQALYILDIDEEKIRQVINSRIDMAKKIAVLIFERQLEKYISRRQHPAEPPSDDSLAW